MDASVAALIDNADKGDGQAASALFALLYTELHRLARAQLARNAMAPTLGTTTLLHEAYLAMAGREGTEFPDRARFMAYAARAMRGLILNHARDRHAGKRGGDLEMTPLDEALAAAAEAEPDLERIGEALERLSALEPKLAQVVDLKFFCGFTFAEIGEMWGQSERTVQRLWEKARIYLHSAIGGTLPA
ncbi:MAG TPA: ECF-type sigma factor [Candidatus Polarisedimenticolia bacterium]|jgi:RNA polymerase sigma factor (TIGR02999 family)|nr:ECF-type sigma factor [Candidatus Polarisedimenticolia bacterium]